MNPNPKRKKTMRKALFFVAAAILMTLAACSDKETGGDANDGRVAVRVTHAAIVGSTPNSPDVAGASYINKERTATTRATDAAWQTGDAIGLVLFEATTATPVEGKTAYKYKTLDEMGNFSASNAENTAYYSPQGEEADVLAFYPYQEIGTDLMVPVGTADQTALSRIDLMVAGKSTGHSATKPDVSLAFSHKLVKLAITVDREASATDVDLNGATVVLQGTATQARWSLTEEKLIADEASKTDINLPVIYDATAPGPASAAATLPGLLSGTAIVLPTAADAGVKLIITTASGRVFDAPLSAGTALVAGTVNTLCVHLRQTEATISATVTDWTTGVTADLRSLEMSVTATDGTVPGVSTLTLWTAAAPASKASYDFAPTTRSWVSPTPFYLESLTADATFFARTTLTEADGGTAAAATGSGMGTRTATPDPVSGLEDVLGNAIAAPLKDGGISLTLGHLYARLSIALLKDETFPASTSLSGAAVTFSTLMKGADISDENRVTARDADAFTFTLDEAGNASFIAPPQEIPAGTTLTVKLKDDNGNGTGTYVAALEHALSLKSGEITTLSLTLTPVKLAINATLSPWETGDESTQSIRIDGLTDGSGKDEISLTAAEGDQLRLTYLADGAASGNTPDSSTSRNTAGSTPGSTPSLAATYLYSADAWICAAPLYWDVLPHTGTQTLTFAALFTPAAPPAGDNEPDYFSGTADTPFGTSPTFVLKHSLARIELQLTATGFTPDEVGAARVSLDAVQPLATIGPDGATTTDADALRPRTLSVDKAGELFSLILAPQSFTTSSRLATITLAGHTYGVSAPDGMKAEAGKTTLLKITLNKSTVSGITVSTTDWATGDTHKGDAGYDD